MSALPALQDQRRRGTIRRRLRRPGVALSLLALWLLATSWWRPLLLPDEGRYVGVALEMLQHDVLVPTLLGLPYFHKPPLMYWIDLAAMQLLGINTLAARMAPMLGGWLMAASLYAHLRWRSSAREAGLALLVLATTPFFFVGAQFANHDMLVAGLITAAIVCARRALELPAASSHLRWLLLAWAAAGLAVLAKGLIGIVLPGLVLVPWLLATRRWRDIGRLLHPLALLLFVAIAVPWFVLMQLRFPAFFDYFFVEQHLRRFAGGGFNNAQPFWFFAPVLVVLTLPWSLGLLAAWRRSARADAARRERGFMLWWLLAVVAFFSLPTSKLVGYVLPALPPLVALLCPVLARRHMVRWLAPLALLLCLVVNFGLAWQAPKSNADIGRALGALWQRGERVIFVDEVFFDVPFYAHLSQPPIVLDDWDAPAGSAKAPADDWRRELRDAARFAAPGAASPLWPRARAAELWCAPGVMWLVVRPGWRPPAEWGETNLAQRGQHAELLRARGAPHAGCP